MVILIWGGASVVLGSQWMPGPLHVARLLFSTATESPHLAAHGMGDFGLLPHVGRTALVFAGGWLLGVGVATSLSLALSGSRVMHQMALMSSAPARIVPPILLAPIAIAILGPGIETEVLGLAAYAAVSFLPYALDSFSSTPQSIVELARLHGASRTWVSYRVRLPSAVDSLMGPAKLVSAFCLGIAVILEFSAAPSGIGRVMRVAQSYTAADLILVCIVWTIGIGRIADLAIDFLGSIARR